MNVAQKIAGDRRIGSHFAEQIPISAGKRLLFRRLECDEVRNTQSVAQHASSGIDVLDLDVARHVIPIAGFLRFLSHAVTICPRSHLSQ